MTELPKEQITQRSGRASVSAPTTDIASPYALIWDAETVHHTTTIHDYARETNRLYGSGFYGIGPYGPESEGK